MGSYYILGYYSKNTNLDGKFRKVKITVAGDNVGKLDYRPGYYGNKTYNKFTTADKERQLEDALMAGDPITELTIAVEMDFFEINRAEYFIPMMIKIHSWTFTRSYTSLWASPTWRWCRTVLLSGEL